MKLGTTISTAALLMLLFMLPASAQNLSVGVRVGSMGPGVELTGALSSRFNARVGAHMFSYQREDEIPNLELRVRADSDLQLGSARAMIDFFPVRRGLRLTAGLIYNENQVKATIVPLEPYTIDGKEFSPEKIGTLTATVSHTSSINPYAGLGFGNSVRQGKRLGLVFDIGVLYTDSPSIEMEGTGLIAPTASEAAELEENLGGIKLYPLVSFGISYKFIGSR